MFISAVWRWSDILDGFRASMKTFWFSDLAVCREIVTVLKEKKKIMELATKNVEKQFSFLVAERSNYSSSLMLIWQCEHYLHKKLKFVPAN